MANNTVVLTPQSETFSGQVIFGVTKTVYNALWKALGETDMTPLSILVSISKAPSFLISRASSDDDQPSYRIYAPAGVFTFVEDKENTDRYTLVAFQKNSLFFQNEAMRYGTMVHIPYGIAFQIRLKEQDIFKDIFYGEIYDSDRLIYQLEDQNEFKKF